MQKYNLQQCFEMFRRHKINGETFVQIGTELNIPKPSVQTCVRRAADLLSDAGALQHIQDSLELTDKEFAEIVSEHHEIDAEGLDRIYRMEDPMLAPETVARILIDNDLDLAVPLEITEVAHTTGDKSFADGVALGQKHAYLHIEATSQYNQIIALQSQLKELKAQYEKSQSDLAEIAKEIEQYGGTVNNED